MVERSLPPLRLLVVFEALARAGSFRKAAAELNVTQPAISQALKALEDHIGVLLLDRSTRPASITVAGRILESAVLEGLGRVSDAVEQIRALRGVAQRSVTIACSIGTATYWLMPRLAGFYTAQPAIAVNVLTTPESPESNVDADMLIRYGRGNWSEGQAIKLFDERIIPVCSPLLRDQVAREGLASATLLHVISEDRSWLGWRNYLERVGLPDHRGQNRYFTNFVQATQAALAGQGVMLGWESNAGDLLREGRLVVANQLPLEADDAFFLCVPHRRKDSEARQAFVAWITGHCRPGQSISHSLS